MIDIQNYFKENGFNSKKFKKEYCLRLIKHIENFIKNKATKEEIQIISYELGSMIEDFDIYGINKHYEEQFESYIAIERLKESIFNK